ncbi:DUF805 domain-containing protein [Blastococcus sp. PRF04-17]|uniref:DUF805 domain-containing protein n=1 Tax=Blastococcus sp. PRF04-17 TaxID=2933797 RepID=UPI001FF2AF49|nr:DUF805 domain-containing protein [Blastococcus sp. PRF04-17]UOY01162.1 DUF805 domain-containing protein [Blastococcus sp. PRF04-17]
MSFSRWYVRRGRIDRQTWWLHYTLPLMLLATLAGIADSSLGYPAPASEGWSIYTYTGGPLSLAVCLAFLAPSVTSIVARLHDRGHSAWWLLWLLVPGLGPLVVFIQNGFLVGQGGVNRYGPPPDEEVMAAQGMSATR